METKGLARLRAGRVAALTCRRHVIHSRSLRIPVIQNEKPIQKDGLYRFGGDEGIRTLDLSDANRTLSQLSYAPATDGIITQS